MGVEPETRKDLAVMTWGVFWYYSRMPVLFELMVKIKHKKRRGVLG